MKASERTIADLIEEYRADPAKTKKIREQARIALEGK